MDHETNFIEILCIMLHLATVHVMQQCLVLQQHIDSDTFGWYFGPSQERYSFYASLTFIALRYYVIVSCI